MTIVDNALISAEETLESIRALATQNSVVSLEALETTLEVIRHPGVQKALALVRAAKSVVASDQRAVSQDFEKWWLEEGQETLYALNTLTDADAKLLAQIAWEKSQQAVAAKPDPVGVVVCDAGGWWGRLSASLPLGANLYAEPVARQQPSETPDPTWIIVNRDGFVPRRMGPFFDPVLIDKTLRELAERYPNALCTVLEAPATMYPTSGQEWLLMHEHNAT